MLYYGSADPPPPPPYVTQYNKRQTHTPTSIALYNLWTIPNLTCDLTAQIRSRISPSPSQVISKSNLKSNLNREILGLETDLTPCH